MNVMIPPKGMSREPRADAGYSDQWSPASLSTQQKSVMTSAPPSREHGCRWGAGAALLITQPCDQECDQLRGRLFTRAEPWLVPVSGWGTARYLRWSRVGHPTPQGGSKGASPLFALPRGGGGLLSRGCYQAIPVLCCCVGAPIEQQNAGCGAGTSSIFVGSMRGQSIWFVECLRARTFPPSRSLSINREPPWSPPEGSSMSTLHLFGKQRGTLLRLPESSG